MDRFLAADSDAERHVAKEKANHDAEVKYLATRERNYNKILIHTNIRFVRLLRFAWMTRFVLGPAIIPLKPLNHATFLRMELPCQSIWKSLRRLTSKTMTLACALILDVLPSFHTKPVSKTTIFLDSISATMQSQSQFHISGLKRNFAWRGSNLQCSSVNREHPWLVRLWLKLNEPSGWSMSFTCALSPHSQLISIDVGKFLVRERRMRLVRSCGLPLKWRPSYSLTACRCAS